MKKNSVKSDKPLRGLGKLGQVENSRLHSTLKRISAHEQERTHGAKPAKSRCPYCGDRTTVKNGKFVNHERHFPYKLTPAGYVRDTEAMYCVGSKTYADMRELGIEQKTSHSSSINGTTVKVGDKVSFTFTFVPSMDTTGVASAGDAGPSIRLALAVGVPVRVSPSPRRAAKSIHLTVIPVGCFGCQAPRLTHPACRRRKLPRAPEPL